MKSVLKPTLKSVGWAGGTSLIVHGLGIFLLLFSFAWRTPIMNSNAPVEVQLWDFPPTDPPSLKLAPEISPPSIAPLIPPESAPLPPEIVLKKSPPKILPKTPQSLLTPALVPAPVASTSVNQVSHRSEEIKRLLDQSHTTNPIETRAELDNAYAQNLGSELRAKVFFDEMASMGKNLQISLHIILDANGRIQSLRKVQTSGVSAFDDAVLRGLSRLSQFPAAKDGTFPPEVRLNYRMRP